MRYRIAVVCVLLISWPMACSVVEGGRVRTVDPPAELTDTLPTTTIEPTTTTVLETTTTGLETTTTEVQTESVRLYYIVDGQLNFVESQLPAQFAPSQLIALLQAGPPQGPVGAGLRTAIPPVGEISASQDGTGVAQVVLPNGFFDTIAATDQRLAIAQIVMTLLDSIPGIGQVTFNRQVSGPTGEVIPAGGELTRLTYSSLLASSTSLNAANITGPADPSTSVEG